MIEGSTILVALARICPALSFDLQLAPSCRKAFLEHCLRVIMTGLAARDEYDQRARFSIDRLLAGEKAPCHGAIISQCTRRGIPVLCLSGRSPSTLVKPQRAVSRIASQARTTYEQKHNRQPA